MAVLKEKELAQLCEDFALADLDRRLDLAYGFFGDLLDTIDELRERLQLRAVRAEMRDLIRRGALIKH